MINRNGILVPQLETIAAYHPQFALAILNGIKARPNLRTIQAVFSSFALNTPVEESFDQQITGYSIFTGCEISLDPTNAFNGNILKGLSDTTTALASGIVVNLLVRAAEDHDYMPIPENTPLQLVPVVLARSAGIWAMNNPDNVKLRFTLTSTPIGDGPLTAWVVFSFLVLGEGAQPYLCIPYDKARAELRKLGYGGSCCPQGGSGAQAAA